jgi:hypothetical protein
METLQNNPRNTLADMPAQEPGGTELGEDMLYSTQKGLFGI